MTHSDNEPKTTMSRNTDSSAGGKLLATQGPSGGLVYQMDRNKHHLLLHLSQYTVPYMYTQGKPSFDNLLKEVIGFICGIRRSSGASLVAQWLRVCLPMQGTRVRALVWEDPTCRGATKPVSHNY